MRTIMNTQQVEASRSVLGSPTVDMLLQVHDDALWMLENMGVGCAQPDMLAAFRQHEDSGRAIVYENRVYVTEDLVRECLAQTPGDRRFLRARNSFFVGGTAPYVYDDAVGQGGLMPTAEHVARIARIADASPVVGGMGRGLKLKDEVEQMDTMIAHCAKPMYYAVTSDRSLDRAVAIHAQRGREMIVFCLTRPCLQVNENFSEHFVKVVRAGLSGVYISHAHGRHQRPVQLQRRAGHDPRRSAFRHLRGPAAATRPHLHPCRVPHHRRPALRI